VASSHAPTNSVDTVTGPADDRIAYAESVARHAPWIVVVVDTDGRVQYVNPCFAELTGWSLEEARGRDWFTTFPPERERERRRAWFANATATVTNARAMVRPIVARDGSELVVEWYGHDVHDGRGELVGHLAFGLDVTSRRAAEDTRLRRIVDGMFAFVGVLSPEGTLLDANRTLFDASGVSRESAVGGVVWEAPFFASLPSAQERLRSMVARAARGEVVRCGIEVELREEVRAFDATLSPVADVEGEVSEILVFAVDVNDLSVTQAALRRSEERLREAVHVASLGIYAHDHPTDALYWSPELRVMCGLTPGEPVSVGRYLELVHPEDRAAMAAGVRRAHDPAGDGRFDAEYRLVRPDGRIVWLTTNSQTIFEGEGEARVPVRTVGAVRDITERERSREVRQRLERQLEEAKRMEAIGTLASGVAHDFALQSDGLEASVRERLNDVLRAGSRGAQLVQQIQAFSTRSSAARFAVSLRPVVEEAAQLTRVNLPPNVTLAISFGEDVPPALVGEGELHQVVMNLCTNARQAIGDSVGSIAVRLERVELDDSAGELHPDLRTGLYARLSVSDTGVGMDAGVRERIFEPFFTTKDVGGGTGLGLSVVHGIVRECGGAITVVSRPGAGTTFHLYLPATDEPVAPPRPADIGLGPAAPVDAHILFVDDEEFLASLGERLLDRLGYRVTACVDPAAALVTVRADPAAFDLVLADFQMPGLSGVDLAREIGRLRPDLPVVLMSGYVTDELHAEADRLGVRCVLSKPLPSSELATVVAGLVSDSRPG
jgi:PAS domain S-box-containing protein